MAAEPAVELKGKINPAQIFHNHGSEATHENIVKQYEEQLKAHQEAAEVAFDTWSKLQPPFSCASTRNKQTGLAQADAKVLLLHRYNCDLTEVNKKKKGEMLTWLSSERAAETAAAAAGGDDDDE